MGHLVNDFNILFLYFMTVLSVLAVVIAVVLMFIIFYVSYTYVLQPVCLVDRRVPVSFIYGGVNNVFHLPQRLPHDVDVGDIQEVQLHIGVEGLTFVPSIFCLHEEWTSEEEPKIAEDLQPAFIVPCWSWPHCSVGHQRW